MSKTKEAYVLLLKIQKMIMFVLISFIFFYLLGFGLFFLFQVLGFLILPKTNVL